MHKEDFLNVFQINGVTTRVYIDKDMALFITYVNGKRYTGESLAELRKQIEATAQEDSPRSETPAPLQVLFVRSSTLAGTIDKIARCHIVTLDNGQPVCTHWADPTSKIDLMTPTRFDDGSFFGVITSASDQDGVINELWMAYDGDLWFALSATVRLANRLTNVVWEHLASMVSNKRGANVQEIRAFTEAISINTETFRTKSASA